MSLRACRNPTAMNKPTLLLLRLRSTTTPVASSSSLISAPISARLGAPKQRLLQPNRALARRQLVALRPTERPSLIAPSSSSSPSPSVAPTTSTPSFASGDEEALLLLSDDDESEDARDLRDPAPPLNLAEGDVETVVSLRALLAFAAPTAAIWVVGPTLGLIDAAVVGTRSALELAALSPGTVLCDYASYIFTFLAVAATNMLSLRFAKGDGDGASGALNDSLTVSLWLGVALAAATLASAPKLLGLLVGGGGGGGGGEIIIAPALSYVRIRAFGAPFALVGFVAQAFFLAALDARTPLAAAALAGLLNLAGDALLVCGLGWGIAGAALATVAAQAAAAAYLLLSLRKPLRAGTAGPPPDELGVEKGHARWTPRVNSLAQMATRVPSRAGARELFGYAGPVVALLATKVALYSACAARAAQAGGGAPGAAAHHVAISAFLFFACAGDSVCAGAQSFLPPAIGSPRRAAAVGKGLLKAGVVAGAANSVLAGVALTAAALPGAFTTCEATRAILASVAPVAAAALGLHCASMATEGMLLAARDLKFQTAANFVNVGLCLSSLWLLTSPASPLLLLGAPSSSSFVSALGLRAIWLVLVQFQGVRLLLNGARLWASGDASPLRWTQPLEVGVAAA